MKDIHKQKASEIFNIPVNGTTPEQRRVGKTNNFLEAYSTPLLSKCTNTVIQGNSDNLTEYDFEEMEKRILTDWRDYQMKTATIKKQQYRGGQDTSSRKVSCPYCKQLQDIVVTFESEKEYTCKFCGNPFVVIMEV